MYPIGTIVGRITSALSNKDPATGAQTYNYVEGLPYKAYVIVGEKKLNPQTNLYDIEATETWLCIWWPKSAEAFESLARRFHKGALIQVTGRFHTGGWTDSLGRKQQGSPYIDVTPSMSQVLSSSPEHRAVDSPQQPSQMVNPQPSTPIVNSPPKDQDMGNIPPISIPGHPSTPNLDDDLPF